VCDGGERKEEGNQEKRERSVFNVVVAVGVREIFGEEMTNESSSRNQLVL